MEVVSIGGPERAIAIEDQISELVVDIGAWMCRLVRSDEDIACGVIISLLEWTRFLLSQHSVPGEKPC